MQESENEQLKIDCYQDFTKKTDRNSQDGLKGIDFVFLGLFGEVGSLLSELKKKQREGCLAYHDAVEEELGDVMWYFSSAALRAGIKLSSLAAEGRADKPITFFTLQREKQNFTDSTVVSANFESQLLALAGKVGSLITKYSAGKIENHQQLFFSDMAEILRIIIVAANTVNVSLEQSARHNMKKTISRWPPENERVWGDLYDKDEIPDEQLPRNIKMVFKENDIKGKKYVIQKCNDINIGDRLTDNSIEDDDYRFHDVFHLAYTAILGWSPVLRALFKVKRKSTPKVDEAQDGARAIIIEEGIATWIFNHGARHNFFEEIKSVEYPLLKVIQDLTKGYEVEDRPLWQWELAILEGFRIFREIRKPENRGGTVFASLEKRTIRFEAPLK